MMFVELFTPWGNLDATGRRLVAGRLGSLCELTGGGAPVGDGTAEVFRSMFQVVVHEPEVWVAGDRPLGPADRPHYLVRVYVPGPWRKDMSHTVIEYVTRVINEVDGGNPAVQVHVLGVPEGGIGLDGRARTSAEIVDLLSEPHQAELGAGRAARDPLCGVIVPLGDDAITLEADGTLHAFCCAGCRDAYVGRRERADRA
ncbi:YHS domain protein [Nonomuraea sp. NPDC048826]|uniref:YHS domain protein n=1 Tax=Nonomuraea sp. NPDC048826 TaxID=3364347 RepID=UPI00371C6FF3